MLKKILTVLAFGIMTTLLACGGGSSNTDTASSEQNGLDAEQNGSTNEPSVSAPPQDNYTPPSVELPTAIPAELLVAVTIDASDSLSGGEPPFVYDWQVIASPAGSSVFSFDDNSNALLQFLPDELGEYIVELTVTDNRGTTATSQAQIYASESIEAISFQPIDAEFSASLNSIVFVRSRPNELVLINPETMDSMSVQLNLVPKAVAVSTDGFEAIVAHDGYLSHIDLASATLLNTFPTSAKAFDVVFANNGYGYIFPSEDQWVSIHSVDLETGVETTSDSFTIYEQTIAKLHPNGRDIYSMSLNSFPSDLEKIDTQENPASVMYDSPYHGDYDMCAGLWISQDGRRIITSCGNAFRSTDVRETDMTYNGTLEEVTSIENLDHAVVSQEIAVIENNEAWWINDSGEAVHQLKLYNYEFLTLKIRALLPNFVAQDKSHKSVGRYVFYSADESSIYVVLQAVPDSGLLNDYAVWKYSR